MGIWAGIKYALNSTLGTSGFKSLDKLIEDVMVNNYITEEKTSQTTISSEITAYSTPQLVASFKIPSDGINMGSLTVSFPITLNNVSYAGYAGLTVNRTISTSSTTTSSEFISNVDFSRTFENLSYETVDASIVAKNVKADDTVYLYILGYSSSRYTKVLANSIVKFTYNAIKDYTFKPITGYVKSIQRGVGKYDYSSSTTYRGPLKVTLSPIHSEKSLVILNGTPIQYSESPYSIMDLGYVSNFTDTSLEISPASYRKNGDFGIIQWQVVEFY